MSGEDPLLDEEFIRVLAIDDEYVANAARNVNREFVRYHEAFGGDPVDAPMCRALNGETVRRHIAMHIGAFRRLQGVRIMEHLVDFGDALRRRRVLSAALSGRSLLETAAAVVFVEENAARLLNEQHHERLLDELHRWYMGGRFDWICAPDLDADRERMRVYASGKEPSIPEDCKATNVLTLIPRLDRRLHATMQTQGIDNDVEGGVIRVAYAMLSDLCHPATGTAILYTQPGATPGWVTMRSTADDRALRWFFWNVGLIIAPIAREARKSLGALGELADTVSDA
jgi:hypothetical protein